MLEAILVILVIAWLLGRRMHFGGNVIHFLLVVAVVILLVRLLR